MNEETLELAALRRLLEVIGGDPEDFVELVNDYLGSTPNLVTQIQKAAALSDWETVFRTAHTLKSNARDFGAFRLANCCASLESAARQGYVELPTILISEIEIEELAARQVLQRISVKDLLG